jgi:hypothetical protein
VYTLISPFNPQTFRNAYSYNTDHREPRQEAHRARAGPHASPPPERADDRARLWRLCEALLPVLSRRLFSASYDVLPHMGHARREHGKRALVLLPLATHMVLQLLLLSDLVLRVCATVSYLQCLWICTPEDLNIHSSRTSSRICAVCTTEGVINNPRVHGCAVLNVLMSQGA